MSDFESDLRRRLSTPAIQLSESLVLGRAHLDHPEFQDLGVGEYVDRYAVVLFLDIRGFTRLSMALSLDDTARIVNGVVGASVESLQRYGAHINDFPGDGVMAVFAGVSRTQDADAAHGSALHAVADLMADMHATLRDDLLQVGVPDPVQIAMGLYSGEVRWQRVGTTDTNRLMALGQVAPLAAKFVTSELTQAWQTMVGGPIADDIPPAYKDEQEDFVRQHGHRKMRRKRWLFDAENFWRNGGDDPASVRTMIESARRPSPAPLVGLEPAVKRRGSGRPDHGVA
jgi:class 3 adenylate cyclase